jgi:Ulp1 protease family, C-terminal catalytic domain
VADRNSEEHARWRILQAYKKLAECATPEKKFTLPSYVNVETSPEESSQEASESHEQVKKRRRLIYVDDRAGVDDEESSPIGTNSDEVCHRSISLSSSSSDEECNVFSFIAASKERIPQQRIPQQLSKFDLLIKMIFDKHADEDDVLVTIPDHPLTRGVLSCLKNGEWLRDDVLDAYMALLQERAFKDGRKFKFLPTHFYQVISTPDYSVRSGLQYMKEQDIFHWQYLFIPINVDGNHWVMVLVDLANKVMWSLDPLPTKSMSPQLAIVARFLCDLAQLRNQVPLQVQSWSRMPMTNIPTQKDGFNCGVYVLLYAELISRPAVLAIDPTTLADMRNRIAVDLVSKHIISGVVG